MAWSIAEPAIGEVQGQERFFLTFPMEKDPEVLRPYWETALAEIGKRLERGTDVAFLTLGDPMLYSTFIYLYEAARDRWPQVPVEIVPGVTSLTGVAAAAGIPLADGAEQIAIVPATYGVDHLVEVLRQFDTVILMKIGSALESVKEALARSGLTDRAVYVSRATGKDQRVIRDVASLQEKDMDCFSTLLVAKKERSGILLGKTQAVQGKNRA
jgi:precorrin-2/cobalt-factor-2 C20-methyltransferase